MDNPKTQSQLRLVLSELRSPSESFTIQRILSNVSLLLTTLQNPLNVTLLTSHVLTAPATWKEHGLQSCHRLMQVFQQAAALIVQAERDASETRAAGSGFRSEKKVAISDIPRGTWLQAVVRGADERSPAWTHALLYAGLLVGFAHPHREHLKAAYRRQITRALVDSINQSFKEATEEDELASASIAMLYAQTREFLPESDTARLNHNDLLYSLVKAVFVSDEGYAGGFFFSGVDADIIQLNAKFTWPQQSLSFSHLASLNKMPIHFGIGKLASAMAAQVQQASDTAAVEMAARKIEDFARVLHAQWRQTKLSEVDVSEEKIYYDEHALTTTLPALWRHLRFATLACINTLQSILARVLNDSALASVPRGPNVARQALFTLRSLYFVSSRLDLQNMPQYKFVFLASIDLLASSYPKTHNFLLAIKPASLGSIPRHPLDRNLDLFFLNAAECLAIHLPVEMNEELLVAAAAPYLEAGGNKNLVEIFESAHSVMLAVLCTPDVARLAEKYAPFYVHALFKVFPSNISSRQFRLAYRTLVEICSPPSKLAALHPELTETLMELLRHRASLQPSNPRAMPYSTAADPDTAEAAATPPLSPRHDDADEERLDERTSLTLALVDCLPTLPNGILEEWLRLTAEIIPIIETRDMRDKVRARFWELLINGEMDVERSRVCATWWHTKGGRELVLAEEEDEQRPRRRDAADDKYTMSGALGPRDSKL